MTAGRGEAVGGLGGAGEPVCTPTPTAVGCGGAAPSTLLWQPNPPRPGVARGASAAPLHPAAPAATAPCHDPLPTFSVPPTLSPASLGLPLQRVPPPPRRRPSPSEPPRQCPAPMPCGEGPHIPPGGGGSAPSPPPPRFPACRPGAACSFFSTKHGHSPPPLLGLGGGDTGNWAHCWALDTGSRGGAACPPRACGAAGRPLCHVAAAAATRPAGVGGHHQEAGPHLRAHWPGDAAGSRGRGRERNGEKRGSPG